MPLKIILFGWLVLKNKVLTWDNIKKRTWLGLGRCVLCGAFEENINHLFTSCDFFHYVWVVVSHSLKLCDQHLKSFRNILLLVWWGVWHQRNKLIFEGKTPNISMAGTKIVAF